MSLKQVWQRALVALLFGFAFALITANTVFGAYFLNRLYPGVRVAGIELGSLTRAQAMARLSERLSGYKLDIQLDQSHNQLDPESIGIEYDLKSTMETAWAEGREAYPPILGVLESRRAANLRYAYSVDQTKLNEFVTTLAASQSQAPVDASIIVVAGQPQVQSDQNGQGVDGTNLMHLVEKAFQSQSPVVAVQRQVLPAKIKSADLETTLESTRKLIATGIELNYADKVFVPSKQTVGGWLTYNNENNQPKTVIDRAKMQSYLNTISAAINVAAKNHLINVQNGVTTGEEPGVDGLAVDQDALAVAITAALSGSGATKLTIPTKPVPSKTVYNRTISLDYGRYIEINLSTQHLWAYEDHKSVFDSPVTSGATGAGLPTVTGLFSIQAKARDRNLNGYAIGYNYNVFVQYWMPFFGNYGMHDASWRSSFGGPDYYYGGSHGCVNLPVETAAWIFNWADVGTPVWVHT